MGQTTTHHNTRMRAGLFLFGVLAALFLFPALGSAQVTATVTGTNVTCFGGYNGSATATGAGGWAPYTYLWSNGLTTATVTGLSAGTYNVTVTDIDLGYAVATITITQPPQLGVQAFGESQICGIVPDGKASAVPFGGTPPYTYLWSNGGTTPQITSLAQGTYTVTVTDNNGCTAIGSATVYFWNEGVWLMASHTNVTCFGFGNGTATAMAMSGTPPYTYVWSTGTTGAMVSNLSPGAYTVTVTDANGCSNFTTVTVTQPTLLTATSTSTNANCGLAGSATITPTGGTSPYVVQWSTGSTNPTISAMSGSYSVTVTDANSCKYITTVTIGGNNTGLTISANVLSSAGCTVGGSALAIVTAGGGGNYAYTWDNGNNTATATNLTAGTHKVTVTDIATGCTGIGTVNIPSASQLVPAVVLVTNATCLVGGSATASATGGTPPYTYKWDNNATTATATNLGAGPHTVTITDAAGCIGTAFVTIGQSQGPSVTATVVTNATCTTGGSATATATGGTSPYVYLWDNGAVTATATGLSVGPHKVTVTDVAGCSGMASVTITQPSAPTLIVAGSSQAGCTTPGSATVAATGGTSPYVYKWSNGAMGAVQSLPAGTYTVTVTDAAGCTGTVILSIAASLPPSVVITASSNANCSQPGSATASAAGGTPPYTYKWDNGETTATATNLAAGPHSVTVTGADGCVASASVTIGSTNNGIKIGDYVWYDVDQDGFQHPTLEIGVPNITVMLLRAGPDGVFGTADDVTVYTRTTDSAGKYLFDCVTPGTYVIMFSGIPSGYEFTAKDNVNNDCKDSDAKANGKTDPFTIVAGQADNLCFDAGIHIFCDNVLNAGTICCNQTICEGQVPALLVPNQPPSGGSGVIEYQWLQLIQIGPAPPSWVGISGATGPTYQPGALTQTSHFMRCARRAGCVSFLESNIITITVTPAGTGTCPSPFMLVAVNQQGTTEVNVQWSTQPEGEQYMYTVQHSANQVSWNKVTTVMGLNNNLQANHYAVVDQTPEDGINYYRIKRTGASGSELYSEVREIELKISTQQTVSIYPNPVTDNLTITNSKAYDTDITIQILTTHGEVLETVNIAKGTTVKQELPVGELPQGLYIARIRFGNGEVKTVKITKF